MKSVLAHRTDPYKKLRGSLERAAAAGISTEKVPLDDANVLAFMVSKEAFRQRFGPRRLWAPFAGPDSRKILRLAGIAKPEFRDLVHLRRLWAGRAYSSGLLSEYIARRRDAGAVSTVSWTSTADGITRLRLLPKPAAAGRAPYPAPPALKALLDETCGFVLFWDQVEGLCRGFAGMSERRAQTLYLAARQGPSPCGGRRALAAFLAGARRKGHRLSEVDEVLWYIANERYSQPASRAETVTYVRYAYLHAYLWIHHPEAHGLTSRSKRPTLSAKAGR